MVFMSRHVISKLLKLNDINLLRTMSFGQCLREKL